MKDGDILACEIPSSDVLAICLILAECDLDMSMAKVIQREEKFEETEHRYFGTGECDFRMSFYWLAYNLGAIQNLTEAEQLPEMLERIPLWEWAKPMLQYNCLFINDEGEYWFEEKDFCNHSEYNRRMREYFSKPVKKDRQSVEYFLRKNGLGKEILYKFTSPF